MQDVPSDLSRVDPSVRLIRGLVASLRPAGREELIAFKADESVERRLEELASKAESGTMSSDEADEYDDLNRTILFVASLQAEARSLRLHVQNAAGALAGS